MNNKVSFLSSIVIKVFFIFVAFDILNSVFFYVFEHVKRLVFGFYFNNYISENKDAIDIIAKNIESIASKKFSDMFIVFDRLAKIIRLVFKYIIMYSFSFFITKFLIGKYNGIN